jgi:hypothetical protein
MDRWNHSIPRLTWGERKWAGLRSAFLEQWSNPIVLNSRQSHPEVTRVSQIHMNFISIPKRFWWNRSEMCIDARKIHFEVFGRDFMAFLLEILGQLDSKLLVVPIHQTIDSKAVNRDRLFCEIVSHVKTWPAVALAGIKDRIVLHHLPKEREW